MKTTLHTHPRLYRVQQYGALALLVVMPLAVKDYTLLPAPDQEFERRALQGRKKYRPAQGKMLIVRGLPPQYRIAGFFAGENAQPLIALTSRTHTDYDRLIQRMLDSVEQGAAGTGLSARR